jgi:hypothetical protein
VTATGNITAYGSYNTTSDETWKSNIRTIENALSKVRQIRGVMYDWNEEYLKDKSPGINRPQTGLIAQEVEKVLPEVVTKTPEGKLLISYDRIMGLVIQSINELADQVDEIKKFISE